MAFEMDDILLQASQEFEGDVDQEMAAKEAYDFMHEGGFSFQLLLEDALAFLTDRQRNVEVSG